MAGSSTVSSSTKPSRTATPVSAPSIPVIIRKSPEASKEQELTDQNDDQKQCKDDGINDWDVDV